MASWSNQQGQQYLHDMDSNGKRLTVRNAVGGATTAFRAEIAERAHPLQAHDALKINGDVVLDYYGDDNQDHLAGSLTVEPAGLFINGRNDLELPNEGGDPAVSIGWSRQPTGEPRRGNYVYIGGKEIGIGPGTAPTTGYPVTLKAPVLIPGGPNFTGDLVLDGKVVARHVDGKPAGEVEERVLGVGRENASRVEIGKPWVSETLPDIPTHVMGPLKVVQASDLQGEVLIRGNITAQSPLLAQNDATVLGNLVVDGNITAQGVLSAVTAPRIIGTGTVISQGSVECLGVASLKEEGCFHYVPSSVRTDREESVGLAVEQLTQNNSVAALHVVNNSMLAEGIGGYFRAPRAIVAEGEVQIIGRTVLNGEAVHASPVLMQSQPIIMGGEGSDEVKMVCGNRRLEFYIDNKLRFYIDENGGHNA